MPTTWRGHASASPWTLPRGIPRATLADIRVGEFVELTHSEQPSWDGNGVHRRPARTDRGQRNLFGIDRERARFGLCGDVNRCGGRLITYGEKGEEEHGGEKKGNRKERKP